MIYSLYIVESKEVVKVMESSDPTNLLLFYDPKVMWIEDSDGQYYLPDSSIYNKEI